MTLADEIKRLRKEAGLSQTALAEAVGVSQGFVTQLETGRSTGFSVDVLFKLAKALGVDCSHFEPWFAGEAQADTPPEALPEEPERARGKRK